jgi:hypothetical protein
VRRKKRAVPATIIESSAEEAHYAQVYDLPALTTYTDLDIICGFHAGKPSQGELMPELIVLRKRSTDCLTSAKGHAHTQ